MVPRRIFPYMVAVATLALAACSTGMRPRPPFDGGLGSRAARIYVTNLNFMEVTVYGVTTGTRQTLGRVPGKGEEVFTLPIEFPTELHLEIDIMAGPYCFTERLTVDPGDEFDLVVQQAGANLNCRAIP